MSSIRLFAFATFSFVLSSFGCVDHPPPPDVVPTPTPENICSLDASPPSFSAFSHAVSGNVSGDLGALFPSENPTLAFENNRTTTRTVARIESSGAYSLDLAPGTYTVFVRGSFADYYSFGEDRRVIAQGITIDGDDLALNFMLDLVTREFEFAFAGEEFPESPDRGAIIFEGGSPQETIVRKLPRTGPARIRVAFPADGIYQAHWSRRATGDLDSVESADSALLPYGEVAFPEAFVVSRWGNDAPRLALDIDVTTVRIDADILLEGESFPSYENDRGILEISNAVNVTVGSSGPIAFSLLLVGAVYDANIMTFDLNLDVSTTYRTFDLCDGADGRCDFSGAQSWAPSVDPLTSDLVTSADFVAEIFGVTTFRCLQTQPIVAGRVSLRNLDNGAQTSGVVGADGIVRIDALDHGRYSVDYANVDDVNGPLGFKRLTEEVVFDGTPLSWTIPMSNVSISLTRNGEVVPDDALVDEDPRGTLVFEVSGQNSAQTFGFGVARFNLGHQGPAEAYAEIVDGAYDIYLDTTVEFGKGGRRDLSQDVFPGGRKLLSSVTFSDASFASVALDVEVAAATVSIAPDVSLGDDDLTENITFIDEDGARFTHPVEDSFSLLLYAGDYDVTHVSRGGTSHLGSLCVAATAPALVLEGAATDDMGPTFD